MLTSSFVVTNSNPISSLNANALKEYRYYTNVKIAISTKNTDVALHTMTFAFSNKNFFPLAIFGLLIFCTTFLIKLFKLFLRVLNLQER